MAPPRDIPTVGRFSVLADPQGATIAAFTPEQRQPEPEGMPPVGEFSWHGSPPPIPTPPSPSTPTSSAGRRPRSIDMGAMGIYQMYGRHGKTLGGIFKKPAEMPGPPAWLYYARVADVNAAIEAARQQGGAGADGTPGSPRRGPDRPVPRPPGRHVRGAPVEGGVGDPSAPGPLFSQPFHPFPTGRRGDSTLAEELLKALSLPSGRRRERGLGE